MRAAVHHHVALVAVREESVAGVGHQFGAVGGAPRELHDDHAGQSEGAPRLLDVRGDLAEVLRDDGQVAELLPQFREEGLARPLDPRSVLRRRLAGRHAPVAHEAAEVVEAHDVDLREDAAHAAHPPRVPVAGHALPVVERVAPELAGGAEVVGRHAGHCRGAAVAVELEEVLVGPHVGAVERHVDGRVADDGDAAPSALGAEGVPLVEEEELGEAVVVHGRGVPVARGGDGLRLVGAQVGVPGVPRAAGVGVLQRHEQGEVVEPRHHVGAGGEPPVGVAQGGPAPLGEAPVREAQQGALPRDHAAVVDRLRGQVGWRGLVRVQQAVAHEEFRADQQRVARHGRETLVGGVAEARGAERKDLPVGQARGAHPLDEAVRLGAQIADAERAGQRGGVEQDAGEALVERHGCSSSGSGRCGYAVSGSGAGELFSGRRRVRVRGARGR